MQSRKNPAKTPSSEGVEQLVAHIREVALFADLKGVPGALEGLAACMKRQTYAPGAGILKEGETGSEMFLLISGDASVYKLTAEGEAYKVAILQGAKHACFGEGGLLGSDARSATIKADTECECLVLDRSVFETFSREHAEWALPIVLRIAHAMMSRLRKTNDDLMLLYHALVAEIRGR